MLAAGAAPAWFVADAASAHPGAGYEAGSGALLSVAVLLVVAHLVKKETGVRFGSLGARGWAAVAGGVVLALVMFSIALGLVASGHRPWLVAPTVLAWAGGTACTAAWFRSCVDAVRRG